jgi:alkylresorcinol/alkylpyrone synthase
MPKLISVGTAVPEYEIGQDEAREFAREMFREAFPQVDRLLGIFGNSAITRRYFSRPREWFEREHKFAERNRIYVETACRLGEEAIRRCLEGTGLTPADLDYLLFVSSTGLATPGIDAHLINRLEMSPQIKRMPVWGLGCAGGVAGLARAMEIARAYPTSRVMLVALELCGLTFRRSDMSKSNLVALSLFGDGAAAVLVTGDEVVLPNLLEAPELVDAFSMLWPDSLDVMGWEVADDGLKVIFSKDIPSMVISHVRPAVYEFLERHGLGVADLRYVIAHPGGMKVVKAYEEALGFAPEQLNHARSVLRDFGNMSSATVLFVLERELEESHHFGGHGLMMALGPGFSAEMLLLRWGAGETGRIHSDGQRGQAFRLLEKGESGE